MLDRSALRDSKPYRDWGGGLLMSATCAIVAASLGFKGMQSVGVFPQPPLEHISLAAQVVIGTNAGKDYAEWLGLHPARSVTYFSIPLAAGAMAGWYAWAWFGRVINPVRHIRGRRYLRGDEAAKASAAATANEVRFSGAGLRMHPNLELAMHQELTSFLFLAGQRGGKTQVLSRLLEQAWARDDKVLAFDYKTDFTQITPKSRDGKEPLIIAPWDSRSVVWDVAKDVRTVHQARAFAAGMVPESGSDPMWANAARALLVAVIMRLISTQGSSWGWNELGRDAYLPVAELKPIADEYYPPAAVIVADAESKTTGSVMINLHAFLSPLYDLRGWSGKKLSLDWWLRAADTPYRNLVVQGNTEQHSLSQALIKSVIETCVSILSSPSFSGDNSQRTWIVMDEFVQFGKIDCIRRIPETLAFRGIALIVAIQSIDQVEQTYGREIKGIFSSIFQIKIFGKIAGATDVQWVQEQVGKRRISRLTRTVSGQGFGSANISQAFTEEDVEVISAQDLAALGPTSVGRKGKKSDAKDLRIRALVLGHGADENGEGGDLLEFTWPLWLHTKHRKAHVPVTSVKTVRADTATLPPSLPPEPQKHELSILFPPVPQSDQDEDRKAEESAVEQVEEDSQLVLHMQNQITDEQQHYGKQEDESGEGAVTEEVIVNQSASAISDIAGIPGLDFAIEAMHSVDEVMSDEGNSGTPESSHTVKQRKRKVRSEYQQ